MKERIYLCISCLFVFTALFFGIDKSLEDRINSIKSKYNFNDEQYDRVIKVVKESVEQYKIPASLIEEIFLRPLPRNINYERFYSGLLSELNFLKKAAELVNLYATRNFSPTDKNYSIKTISNLFSFGLTEDECKKFMALLQAQGNSFDDSVAKLNYYVILKKYFVIKNPSLYKVVGVENPAEIIFLKYYMLSIKDLSLIIGAINKYFQVSYDAKTLYDVLSSSKFFSSKEICSKIEGLMKKELRKEVVK